MFHCLPPPPIAFQATFIHSEMKASTLSKYLLTITSLNFSITLCPAMRTNFDSFSFPLFSEPFSIHYLTIFSHQSQAFLERGCSRQPSFQLLQYFGSNRSQETRIVPFSSPHSYQFLLKIIVAFALSFYNPPRYFLYQFYKCRFLSFCPQIMNETIWHFANRRQEWIVC